MQDFQKGGEKMNKEVEEIVKKLKREYFREWRAKNRDKCATNSKNYWLRKALKEKE